MTVPHEPDYSDIARFSLATADGPITCVTYASHADQYGYPILGIGPLQTQQQVRLEFAERRQPLIGRMSKLVERERFLVAFDIRPSAETFKVVACALTGLARRIRNPERIRKSAREANRQIKAAAAVLPAPGVLFLFQSGWDVPDDRVVGSAFFGDLTVVFGRDGDSDNDLTFGCNGIWSERANRSTSGALLFRNLGEPTLFHNPWAHHPLPRGIFKCPEWVAIGDQYKRMTNQDR